MRKVPGLLALCALPLLLSACTMPNQPTSPTPSAKPSVRATPRTTPAPTASPGQVLASVTASTNEGEATTFTVPSGGYKVQVLCEGSAKAKLRVSVNTQGRQLDAEHSVQDETNSATTDCLTSKPYYLITAAPNGNTKAQTALVRIEILSGTVNHASATVVAQ